MKRAQSIGMIAAIIIVCIFAAPMFASCIESAPLTLAEYKEAAKAELEAYARAKGTRQEFTADEWEAMQEYIVLTKTDIDNAYGETGVDVTVFWAKQELDHYFYTIAGLAAFKGPAKAELEAVFDSYKTEGRFAVEDWGKAQQEVADAKTAIDAAVSGRDAYIAFYRTKLYFETIYTFHFGDAIFYNKQDIRRHAYEIRKNIYTVEDWNAITGILEQGEAAINAAAGYGEIEAAVDTAIAAMDAVELAVAIEKDLYNTIKQDYFEEYGKEFWFSRFYGFHNGAAVFFILGMDNIEKVVTVSGVEFSFYNSDWSILIYKDGSFYDLEKDIAAVFDAGVLTQADLAAIGEINARPESEWPNGLGSYEGLSIEDELSIKKSLYHATRGAMYESFICYFGAYDGYVLFIELFGGTFWGRCQEIDSLKFFFPEGVPVIDIRNGGGHSDLDLKGLYENGIITREELQDIYLQYLEYFHDKYTS